MSTPTPTPRMTSACGFPSTDWEKVAESIFEEGCKLERELSDMQARAEAAEAACEIMRDALLPVQEIYAAIPDTMTRGDTFERGCSLTPPQIRKMQIALNSSPAETRSVIAGLREKLEKREDDLARVRHALDRLYNTNGDLCQQIAGLREEVAAITSEYEEAKRLYMENDERAVQISNHACDLEAQLAALISVVVPHIEDLRKTSVELSVPSLAGCFDLTAAEILIAADELQAAVSGAQAGAKGKP